MEFITNLKRSTILILSLVASLTAIAKDKQRTISVETADMKVKVEFYSPEIVRVVKQPKGAAPMEKKSFSVILHPGEKFGVDVDESKDGKYAMLSSSRMSVRLDKKTGQLLILGVQGTPIIKEKATKMVVRKGDADEGKQKVGQTWTLEDNEAIFGLGQLRDETICWRGQKKILWNDNTYIAIPYITSEKGYGIYWDNAGKSLFEDSADGMTFESEVAEGVDYYVMYRDGKQDGVIVAIRQLTGQATMFPLWTMGHWQCRERYKTSDELCDVLDKYRKLRIPLDGIVQDWQYWGCDSNWNAMRFENPYYINKVGDEQWAKYLPNDLKKLAEEYKKAGKQPRIKSPEEMAKYVHDNHAHLMISIWASFGPWTKAYQRLNEIGGLLPFETWPRNNGVKPYDPFNAQARDIYWDELTHLYNIGFDAWWTDSTEPDHFAKDGDEDYKTSAGTWRSVKNAFPLMTNKGIYEHQRAMKGNHKRSVQMTRSGAMGIQHYGTFSWSGDIQATWAEMKKQVPSGLNYTLCGIPFWNTDLGGFFYWDMDNNPKSPAVQELQVRWMQWGTFMPLMRNHCSSPMVSELYEFGKEGDWAYDVMKQYIELRYRLLPYIYSMAGEVVQHSGMMMRPLLMDYTDDRKAILRNDEYMFGRELLVKPVTDPLYTWLGTDKKGHLIYPDIKKAAAPVEVYLPKGNDWYDFWTGEKVRGGRTVKRPCPINEMPVYVKAGSILPMGPQVQYSDEKPWDNLELRIYPGQDGKFTLYEDEGDNYNYEKGDFSEIQFSWDDKENTLTIHQRKGEYKGMLKKRNFRIVIGVKGDKEPKKFDKTISYEGKKVTVKL